MLQMESGALREGFFGGIASWMGCSGWVSVGRGWACAGRNPGAVGGWSGVVRSGLRSMLRAVSFACVPWRFSGFRPKMDTSVPLESNFSGTLLTNRMIFPFFQRDTFDQGGFSSSGTLLTNSNLSGTLLTIPEWDTFDHVAIPFNRPAINFVGPQRMISDQSFSLLDHFDPKSPYLPTSL